MTDRLTDKQLAILRIVHDDYVRTGLAPSVREIARRVGVTSTCTIQRHLDALEKKGYIHRDRYKYRSLRPVGASATTARIAALERELAALREMEVRG